MLKVTKEKNWLIFTDENGKDRKIDINTGKTYGVRGTEIQSKIPHITSYFRTDTQFYNISSERCHILIRVYCDYNLSNMAKIEKWFNLGFDFVSVHTFLQIEPYITDHRKDFIKFMREKGETLISHESVEAFKNELYRVRLAKLKTDHFVTDDIVNIIANYEQISDKEAPIYAFFLAHGLLDFYGYDGAYCTSRFAGTPYAVRNAIDNIRGYLNFCHEKGYTPDTKEQNIFRTLTNMQKEKRADKIQFDNNALAEFYAKKSWDCETDDLFIKIPTCRQDFVNEANQQNNCVYSSYFKDTVNGYSYVVFIRRKDNPDKSYITCEIRTDGYIQQYLGKNNHMVEDEVGKQFYHTLHDFIDKNW